MIGLLSSELTQTIHHQKMQCVIYHAMYYLKERPTLTFMIDGSDTAKKKFIYEGELFYLRIAPGSVPSAQLWNFISMKPYVATDTTNPLIVMLRCMQSVLNSNDIMTTEIGDMCP